MKIKKILGAILLITLAAQNLVSQINSPSRQPSSQEAGKSIHQLDWERHQDFVQTEKLPVFEGRPMAFIPRSNPPSREIFGYLPYWTFNNYPNLNYNLLTTIAYFGADIDEFGNITNLHDWPAPGLINRAHSEGVRVVLTAILFNSGNIAALLSNPARRTTLVNNLLIQVQNANADGVNIDFEGVPSGQRDNLTAFMTELAQTFHTNIPGSFITIFSPAVDWSNVFDYFLLAENTDGLVMQGYDYHWSTAPTAGPVAPLTGNRWGFPNVTWTVEDYLGKTLFNIQKLILSVPFYGFEWQTVDDGLESPTIGSGTAIIYSVAYPNAQQYGRLWDTESQTPWYKYNDGQWHQGWYDDSLSLALKFNLVNQEDLKGTAIWALSYDGQRLELQQALANAFGSSAPPLRPAELRIRNVGSGDVEIAVNPSAGATGYRIYKSANGVNFDLGTLYPNAANILSALSTDTTYYFKVSAQNGNGESNLTEVLAVRPSNAPVDILIVNGFDRTTGTVNTFDFVKRFAPAVAKLGLEFDACANEAIESGAVSLLNYSTALWISGEEGTANESFSITEQNRVADYLENGGNLFISGSEIGYDLVEQGSSSDQLFYTTYFKAEYILDKVPTYVVSGTSSGIFSNLSAMNFDNGTHGTYNVDFPDGIKPAGGSLSSMTYDGFPPASFGGSGIQYEGVFGSGTAAGKLVYLGFPFETLYPESTRDNVMARVLAFFDLITGFTPGPVPGTLPQEFQLSQNYPNPFNPSTTILYKLTNSSPLPTTLVIYDILGKEVVTLVNKPQRAGQYEVVWDGRNAHGAQVASGIYIYRLQVDNKVRSHKMTLIR